MKLAREQQDRARGFLMEQARPLERSLYRYRFEGGPVAEVLLELHAFQNADGGYGHGLEPDLRTPVSTVIATTVALQTLREVDVPSDCPEVQGALHFLKANYNAEHRYWPNTVPAVNDAPHAPWWHYGEDRPEQWQKELLNSRAEIVGYLFDYTEGSEREAAQGLLRDTLELLRSHVEPLEMHDLLCCAHLAETRNLPSDVRVGLLALLRAAAPRVVQTDEAKWGDYGLKPLTLCPSPASPLAPLFSEALERNLDYEIGRQGGDGAWNPAWSWPGEAWHDAEREWKGWLTLRTLLSLRDYGRLE